MTDEHRMEQLSQAYVQAVAAMCGCSCAKPQPDYGVDLTLRRIEWLGNRLMPLGRSLDLQLRSTVGALITADSILHDLAVRTYDLLRRATRISPLYLVLLLLPSARSDWLIYSEDRLELRRCAYWISLCREPPVANSSSIRITIPRRNQFTPPELERIMEAVQREEDVR
jgi:hypothetical protein